MKPAIAAVILAAGESARLGRPKQLLPYRGRTLLRHVVGCAAAACDPVVVVLGAGAEEMRTELEGTPARAVVNSEWREGMSSSIRAGVEELRPVQPEPDAVLLLACDQYRISADIVESVCQGYAETGARIVACEYAGTVGVPALFARELFPELDRLSGSGGAKTLLVEHAAEVVRVPWAEGARDVDTEQDRGLLGS